MRCRRGRECVFMLVMWKCVAFVGDGKVMWGCLNMYGARGCRGLKLLDERKDGRMLTLMLKCVGVVGSLWLFVFVVFERCVIVSLYPNYNI